MKLMKRKDLECTIRTVWNDEKTMPIGLIGTAYDLKRYNIFSLYDGENLWCFIPCNGKNVILKNSREEIIEYIKKYEKEVK